MNDGPIRTVTHKFFLQMVNLESASSLEPSGRFAMPQSPWRWDDHSNSLVHDRDVTVEKADINAESASEKIDLWNIPPGRRPPVYEKYPLEVAKDKKFVTVEDITHIALNMVSDTYFVPERFADFVNRPVLIDFFLYLINYFYWYFEYLDSQIITNPLCVELDHEERNRISLAQGHMQTALILVAQKYSNIVLGTGLKQFHHFYWIEGNDGDPLTKKREIIPYSGRVSRTLIDRGYAELLMIFSTFVVWITFERQRFEIIRAEIGRIIRTNAFPNPTYSTTQLRNRSARRNTSESNVIGEKKDDDGMSTNTERKRTGASNKSTRSQKTIATASSDATTASGTTGHGPKKTSIQRLLTQRSPALVTLLPTARDQSAWLFSRRNDKKNQSSKAVKPVPESEFQVRREIGVLGQPIDALTMIVGEGTSAGRASASRSAHVDHSRRNSEDLLGDINSDVPESSPRVPLQVSAP